ncbi:hypothetical protein [Caulobacter sp. 17J80-11]|uniref:hypothetical protein n=1 Tax=Caulobacter sp. 17J80-11 TaxID=2763502 RepID=UPI001653ABB2|nr:hypothetical protein [Caulobacter sp. 17J80-11]MBC6983278.1 hypothetical protein [Caulobacter sp. 17J80-11]
MTRQIETAGLASHTLWPGLRFRRGLTTAEVAVVVRLGDRREELGDGRVRLRFSRNRLDQVSRTPGADVRRLQALSVIWDEREDEILDIREDRFQCWSEEDDLWLEARCA